MTSLDRPVVRTLKNAVSTGRISHAYIFQARGNRQDSTARVPRALSTVKRGRRLTCGSAVLVCHTETKPMDAMRSTQPPTEESRSETSEGNVCAYSGSTRYIIDEAHGWRLHRAFLKTLRTAHVIFVLATTEPESIIETIRSRQRFDFNRLSVPDLADHVSRVAAAQSISIDPDAARLIARRADGSARDALGLLEQASAWSDCVTSQSVLELLGTSDYDTLRNYADAARLGEPGPLLQIIRDVVESGADMRQFLQDLVIHFRNLLVAKECPDLPGCSMHQRQSRLNRQTGCPV